MFVELKNIEKRYETPSGKQPLQVLNDISLQIEQGETIAIVGPSGCGKSSLLNLIGALDKPTSGTVHFEGLDLAAMNENELSDFRSRQIGFVFQLHHLLPQCTVMENVLIPVIPAGESNKDGAVVRAKSLLEKVGLQDHLDYFPGVLSGGEQQRVAVARALINKPKLILADEPTGSLDSVSAENLVQILIDLNRAENTTLIMVTHSLDLAKRMDKIYKLQNGKLEEFNR